MARIRALTRSCDLVSVVNSRRIEASECESQKLLSGSARYPRSDSISTSLSGQTTVTVGSSLMDFAQRHLCSSHVFAPTNGTQDTHLASASQTPSVWMALPSSS